MFVKLILKQIYYLITVQRKIFLSRLPESNMYLRKKMVGIINRAGMDVVNPTDDFSDEKRCELIQSSDIILSVITSEILDNKNKNIFQGIESLNEHADLISQKLTIVWCSKELIEVLKGKGEFKVIENLKRLISNQHFISYSSLIKLVDDLRRMKLNKEEKKSEKLHDITFICNENDKKKAGDIQLIIDNILKINPIYIDYSNEMNYASICSESILNSTLCVVYSKNSTEWAVNFSQQVWKIIGGVSSNVPILTIFDKEFTSPEQVSLEVPNIYKMFTEDTLAGLEIKMFFEKITIN